MEHAVLQFDYDEVHGMPFSMAMGTEELRLDNGTKCYDEISLMLNDGSAISIRTTGDTDELIVERIIPISGVELAQSRDAEIEFLNEYSGRELGWCWVGVNWRGYKDTFLLSFESLNPQVAFVAVASKVHLYRLVAQG